MGCALMQLPGMKPRPWPIHTSPATTSSAATMIAHDGQYEAILGVDQVGEAIGACLDASGRLVRHALTERDRNSSRRALIWRLSDCLFPNQWTVSTVRPTNSPHQMPSGHATQRRYQSKVGLVWFGVVRAGRPWVAVSYRSRRRNGAPGHSARRRSSPGRRVRPSARATAGRRRQRWTLLPSNSALWTSWAMGISTPWSAASSSAASTV